MTTKYFRFTWKNALVLIFGDILFLQTFRVVLEITSRKILKFNGHGNSAHKLSLKNIPKTDHR
jgi:hypothetical protein